MVMVGEVLHTGREEFRYFEHLPMLDPPPTYSSHSHEAFRFPATGSTAKRADRLPIASGKMEFSRRDRWAALKFAFTTTAFVSAKIRMGCRPAPTSRRLPGNNF